MVDWLRHRDEEPAWREIPDEIEQALARPLAPGGETEEAIYADFLETVLPYSLGNTHPRFFGWVHGAGTPIGALAGFLAATMNANLGGRAQAPVLVERQVLDWARELFGFPAGSGGILLSGTSMATVVGLAVARHRATGGRDRVDGIQDPSRLVGYTSAEAHNSIAKAFELLGLGSDALREIPVDDDGGLDPEQLERAVREDLEAGHHPFAVVATVGSVNTGGFDDLLALRRVADRHDLWLHVDGAFGAAAQLSSRFAPMLEGIDRVDSLAFDFHKWLQVPYDAGCVLIRDGELHRATFESRRDYLTSQERGAASGEPWFCDFGPELSRGFRALKVWFTLRHYGIERLGQMVERACDQATHLGDRVEAEAELELMAPVTLNVVCFRFRDDTATPAELDRLNREILTELHERGLAVPSPTRVGDQFALRVCICNHRTGPDDIDALAEATLAIGREVSGLVAV
ncbi:MAG: cytochrome D ubiquinol oxidase subunit I [Gemmatimonadales bacterium]|nr:MAG: cytochrome D ubiquinol oxidase subunit I [Gemmatimonadales bacterium]